MKDHWRQKYPDLPKVHLDGHHLLNYVLHLRKINVWPLIQGSYVLSVVEKHLYSTNIIPLEAAICYWSTANNGQTCDIEGDAISIKATQSLEEPDREMK